MVARPFNKPNAPLSEGAAPRRYGPDSARESALDTGRVIPGGKAIEPIRKPKRSHRPQAVGYSHEDADSGSNNPNAV